MKYYRFPDNLAFKIGFPVFLLLMQLLARSTAYANIFIGIEASYLLGFGLTAVFGVVFLIYNRKALLSVLTDRRIFAAIVMTALVIVPMLVKRDWQLMYFSILLCLYLPVFLSYFVTLKEASRCYVLISTVLAAYSLVGLFVLKPLAQAGLFPARTFYSTGGWLMYDFGLTHSVILNNLGAPALRNFGFFREPGLYQLFLFIAILINNEWADWEKNWQRWLANGILMVTLLTTFATGGVLALGLYLVFLFFDTGLYRKRWAVIGASVACTAGIGAIALALAQGGTWAYELVGMVEKVYNMTSSLTYRVDAIFENFYIFLHNPLFGESIATVLYSVTSNTSSTMIMFAIFGIGGGVLHVLSWVALLWKKDRPVVGNLALLVIAFITFNTQNTIHDTFLWLFPMLALMERGLPLLNFRKKV